MGIGASLSDSGFVPEHLSSWLSYSHLSTDLFLCQLTDSTSEVLKLCIPLLEFYLSNFSQNKQLLFCHCQDKTLSSTNSTLLLLSPLLPEQHKSTRPHRRDFPPISTLKIFLSGNSVFLVPCWKPASFCKPCPTEAVHQASPSSNAIFGGVQGISFLSSADGACDLHFRPQRSKNLPK